MKWIARTVDTERRRLERARKRFVAHPTPERLHDVRTTARRLRSLLEDVRTIYSGGKLRRRLKRAAAVTDGARDAAVLLALLDSRLDETERSAAGVLLDQLRAAEVSATVRVRRRLRTMRFT
jgi:CHAD domain-containing protein